MNRWLCFHSLARGRQGACGSGQSGNSSTSRLTIFNVLKQAFNLLSVSPVIRQRGGSGRSGMPGLCGKPDHQVVTGAIGGGWFSLAWPRPELRAGPSWQSLQLTIS